LQNDSFKYAIVLTGGIATGKSTVGNLLKLHGFLIIDADEIAHKLLDINSAEIADLFGEKFVENGKVLRKQLGDLVFNDKSRMKKLEQFIHPKIKEQIVKEAKIFEEKKKPYFIDIPLFFETRNYDIDRSLVVYTPKELQVERLMKRDNVSKDEALKKISIQLNIEKKKKMATYVIDNSSSLKHLQKEVERVIGEIL